MIDLDDARERLLGTLTALTATERVILADAAGRVTARDLHAALAVPPFANAAMDGYALHHADPALHSDTGLTVAREIFAGRATDATLAPGECARIFTGAVVPTGADAVIAQEDAEVLADGRVRFREQAHAGKFVRPAGDDVAADERIIAAGVRLHAGHIGLLAATGVTTLEAYRQPRLAIITNGDELRLPGAELAAGEIYDSSRFSLPALARTLPVEVVEVAHAPDDPARLRDVLTDASRSADAVVCAGGVSVGDADHVRDVIQADGEIGFWRLALKPGKPFAFGNYRGTPLFGLPGNPVSSLVTFLLLVRPALQQLAGMPAESLPRYRARLTQPVHKTPGRRDFQRARLGSDATGALTATAFAHQGSHVLSVLAAADALLDLPADSGDLDAGAEVLVIPLASLLG